jgi:membrane dipeptidase
MATRRNFIALAGAAAFASIAPIRSWSADAFTRTRYKESIIVDALCGIGGSDPDAKADDRLSPRDIADAKATGLTAINITVSEVGNAPGVFDKTVANIAWVDEECAGHPDLFLKVLSGSDLSLTRTTRRLGFIYGFQDCSALEGDLSRLNLFHGLGVRIIQPTYNRRNAMGDGCLETADGGLSSLGHELVGEMNKLGILLDLSHAGRRTISEGIAASSRPMAITHTGCRDLVDVPRNVYDSELRALANKGGVVGMYFMPFLRAEGQPHSSDLIRHLEHAVNVCGEDHVGIGTDGSTSGQRIDERGREAQRKFFEARKKAGIAAPGEAADVFNLIPEYNDPNRYFALAEDLAHAGWRSGRIEKVLGRNFARLFNEIWA